MNNIEISFIIPIYNCSSYIEECVRSIYACYCDENIECILVDDGSTDNSKIICDNISGKYKNVKALHKKNGGVSSARNYGLENAKGKYITFVDADDYIAKTDFSFLSSEKELYVLGMQRLEGNKVIGMKFKHKSIQKDLITYPVYMNSVCNKFFRSDIIEKFYIRFDEKQYATEDLLFLINYLVHINMIEYRNQPYYIYRMDENSATHKKFTKTTAINNVVSVKKVEKVLKDNYAYRSFLRYLRIKSALPFIANKECFDPDLYRECIKPYDIWTFDMRIDKTLLSLFALLKLDLFLNIYVILKDIVRNLSGK